MTKKNRRTTHIPSPRPLAVVPKPEAPRLAPMVPVLAPGPVDSVLAEATARAEDLTKLVTDIAALKADEQPPAPRLVRGSPEAATACKAAIDAACAHYGFAVVAELIEVAPTVYQTRPSLRPKA